LTCTIGTSVKFSEAVNDCNNYSAALKCYCAGVVKG